LQLAAVPEMRGRVMALWALAWMGSTPIGGPIVGWLAQEFGPRWGLLVGGLPTPALGLALYPPVGGLDRVRAAEAATTVIEPVGVRVDGATVSTQPEADRV